MRLVVANLKGGSGKTSSALFLAEAAAERGPTLLVDADPQGSAMQWAEIAADDGHDLRAVAVALATKDLPRRLEAIAEGYPVVVIDTPPGDHGIVQAAIRAGDVVLVPCQPTLMDLDRVRLTLDLAAENGRPAAVLLTRTRPRLRSFAAAVEALEAADLPVLTASIPQRDAIAQAFGARPRGAALELYAAVLDELESALR